jgi:hypothetical protein
MINTQSHQNSLFVTKHYRAVKPSETHISIPLFILVPLISYILRFSASANCSISIEENVFDKPKL